MSAFRCPTGFQLWKRSPYFEALGPDGGLLDQGQGTYCVSTGFSIEINVMKRGAVDEVPSDGKRKYSDIRYRSRIWR